MNTPLISVQNFKMQFGSKRVIEDLSFEVKRGEVFGFLGSNGSGKTTTIRSLLGIYRPTAGELLINGKPFDPSMSNFLGYLPEERGLYKKEKVLDTMVYFGQLKGLSAAEAREWSLDYLKRVDLADKAGELLEKLSGGQQQKVQLGVTIMNNPQLLILDEPTKGFDPINRRLIMEIIEERQKEGATVIMVTHQMDEVERVCDRIMLLKDGTRRLYGTVEEVRSQYGSQVVSIEFSGALAKDEKHYSVLKSTSVSAELQPKEGVSTQQVFAALAEQKKVSVSSFKVQQSSLDDIFVQIYQEGERHA